MKSLFRPFLGALLLTGLATLPSLHADSGFTGAFDYQNFVFESGGTGATYSADANTLSVTGSENGDNFQTLSKLFTSIDGDYLISFTWSYSTTDISAIYDPAGYLAPAATQLTTGSSLTQSGSTSFFFEGGIFGIYSQADNYPSEDGHSTLAITNFTFTATSAPSSVWNGTAGSNWSQTANWNNAVSPTGTTARAEFGVSDNTSVTIDTATTLGRMTFTAGASSYTFTNTGGLSFYGRGIINNSGTTQTIDNSGIFGNMAFRNSSSAGDAVINNSASMSFFEDASSGSATITNTSAGTLGFFNEATAADATINNAGDMTFNGDSTAGNAIINNTNGLNFLDNASAGNATISSNSQGMGFYGNSTAGNATINILTDGALFFLNQSTSGSATINAQSAVIRYYDESTADGTTLNLLAGSSVVLDDLSNSSIHIGSITGATTSYVSLGDKTLYAGGLNTSGTLGATIYGGTDAGVFSKEGTGSLTLTGTSSFYEYEQKLGTTVVTGSMANTIVSVGDYVDFYDTGTFAVQSGGRVKADLFQFANADVIVSGSGSILTAKGTGWGQLIMSGGDSGSSTLSVSNRARVVADTFRVSGGTNAVTITGSSVFTSTVGFSVSGQTTVQVVNGGTLNTASAEFYDYDDVSPSITVSGSRSVWTDSSIIRVGTSGGHAAMTVGDRAQVTTPSLFVAESSNSGTSSLTVTGSSLLTVSSGLEVARGGIGAMTVSNSGTVNSSGQDYVGSNQASRVGSSGTLAITGTGSRYISQGSLTIGGRNSDGYLLVEKGGFLDASSLTLASSSSGGTANRGAGTILQTGGTISASGQFNFGGGTASYALEGGVLRLGGNMTGTSGVMNFELAGGNVQYTANAVRVNVNSTTLRASTTSTISTAFTNTWSGSLVGSGALTKAGTGTISILGTNSYSGGTEIAAGTLAVGTDTALGSGTISFTGSSAIAPIGTRTLSNAIAINNVTGTFNGTGTQLTLSGPISGSGELAKAGSGTLTLSGSNSFSGNTRVINGLVILANDNALGSSTLIFGGGTIQSNASRTFANAGLLTANSALIGSTNFGLTGTFANSNNLTLTVSNTGTTTFGAVDLSNSSLTRTLTLNTTGGPVNITGVVSNGTAASSGNLTKTGSGTLTLSSANTFSGATTISAGTLQLGNGGSAGSVSGTITNNSTLTFNRSDAFTASNRIIGTGTVRQVGTGAVSLTGSNSYSGGTVISSGTLIADNNNAVGTSTVTVSGGVFMIANGRTVSNTVSLTGGVLAQGMAGNSALASLKAYQGNIPGGTATTASFLGGTSSAPATVLGSFSDESIASNDSIRRSDIFDLSGMPVVNISTGETDKFVLRLQVTGLGANSLLGWYDSDSGLWVNAVFGNFGINDIQYISGAYDGNFVLGHYGFDSATGTVWAVLNHNSDFAVVPEPSTWALLGLALAGLLLLRRRHAGCTARSSS